jgi:hypothetical protein
MNRTTKRNSYVTLGSILIGYLILFPISTAIVLIFEQHVFDLRRFGTALFRDGHIYTGFLFMLVGLFAGLIIVHFLRKQDVLNIELMVINDYLKATNDGLRKLINNRHSDSHVFLESIRPTIRQIDKAVNKMDINQIQDIDHNQQIVITKRNIKQIVDLIDVIMTNDTDSRELSERSHTVEEGREDVTL